jgi:ribosomal-protein-alanine N-acetyltransferase
LRRPTVFESLDKQPTLTGKSVKLRARRLENAADEYRWRTNEELCRLDATAPFDNTFGEFFQRFSIEIEYPGLTYNFAIETPDGKHIGDCSLFHIDYLSDNAEIGIMIGERKYWDQGYGADAILTFLHHIFQLSDLIPLHTLSQKDVHHSSYDISQNVVW